VYSWLHGCVILDLIVLSFSSHYEVIVVKEVSGDDEKEYKTYPNATEVTPRELDEYSWAHKVEQSVVYLAAVYTNMSLPDRFELGNGSKTDIMTSTNLKNRTAFNGPLKEDLSYRVFLRVYAQTQLSEKVHIAVVFIVNYT
jgi:hypothetical protein